MPCLDTAIRHLHGLEAQMIEAIRTFWGKLRGEHGNRQTVVQQGTMWRCTKCNMIFTIKLAGEQHGCSERI